MELARTDEARTDEAVTVKARVTGVGKDGSRRERTRRTRSLVSGTRASRARRGTTDAGSSIVEAVIVIPVVMVLLLVAVQFALWMHAAQVVQLAASEGDRSARSIGGGAAAGTVSAQAVVDGPGSDVSSPAITVAVLAGDAELLRVSGTATSVLPGLSFAVSASAIGPIQEFRGSE